MIAARPDIDPEGRYSVLQAAKALQVGATSIRRWIAAGHLRTDMRMRSVCVRIKGKELLSFWAQH